MLAFLGENGAGKSILLKVLNGDYQPNKGEYLLDSVENHCRTPHEAIEEGISLIYQERQIFMKLSVAENVHLGHMPTNKMGVINIRQANKMAQKNINDFAATYFSSDSIGAGSVYLLATQSINLDKQAI